MKIYLAGKIEEFGDWRSSLVDFLDNDEILSRIEDWEFTNFFVGRDWPVMENSLPGGHDFVGPYYKRGRHWEKLNVHSLPDSTLDDIFIRCKSAISRADIVFAWIPGVDIEEYEEYMESQDKKLLLNDITVGEVHAPTCYGTIAELGMAHAMGKRIMIAGLYRHPELWFVYKLASKTMFDLNLTAEKAFETLITPDYYTYIRSPQWRKKADAAKARAGYRCQVCNRPASEITLDAHHRTYERLGNERPEDITVLCRDCHSLFEENKKAARKATR
jgi:hypothetical protein